MEGSGSATIKKNAADPKHQEEEETSPNRNHELKVTDSRKISSLFPSKIIKRTIIKTKIVNAAQFLIINYYQLVVKASVSILGRRSKDWYNS